MRCGGRNRLVKNLICMAVVRRQYSMQRFLNNWSVLCTATEAHFGKGTKGDTALPTLPNPHYPSKIANTLASLVKGRWIDGKAQTVALLHLNCDTPALFITKPFCRQDGGIAAPTFAPHYPTRFSWCECDSPASHKNKIRPRFHGGELIKSLIYKY